MRLTGNLGRRRTALALTIVMSCGASPETMSQSPIDDDEFVVIFPTCGRLSESADEWIFPVHGWIFEPEADSRRRAALLEALRRTWGLERDAQESTLFERRARRFLVDNERGQQISVEAAGTIAAMPASQPNGHFRGELRLAAQAVAAHADRGILTVRAVTRPEDRRTFMGQLHLVENEGVSVISDIDDTLKISDVRDRKTLLRRTFLQEFESVPGMAQLYTEWRKKGATFHYVSSSPWQLYEPLSEFMEQAGFPHGTFDLRDFRLTDRAVANLWTAPDAHKTEAIAAILRRYPKRRFALVGDSGERDPEIYGKIAREFPGQVAAILIRNVTGEARDSARYAEAFVGVPPEKWKTFDSPQELTGYRW